jgi:hypothetical protein
MKSSAYRDREVLSSDRFGSGARLRSNRRRDLLGFRSTGLSHRLGHEQENPLILFARVPPGYVIACLALGPPLRPVSPIRPESELADRPRRGDE